MREVKEKVEAELKALRYELRHELPKEIERATALGDLRENAEYHAALDRQRFVRARIGQLEQRMSQLSTMNLAKIPKDRAGYGSRVTVTDLDADETVEYELVAADEGDPGNGKISISSPIGRALVGRKVGDAVTVVTPRGEREFELVALMTMHERKGGASAPD